MNFGVYLSLGVYFALMLAIGLYSYLNTQKSASGFMLGGRSLGPAVTALSAGASDMSGWMLMGLPGLVYASGISGSWIAIGLIIGMYCNYRLLAPRLRVYTEYLDDALTIPEYLGRRFADNKHLIRIVCTLVIIVFFAIYTTSGVVAGGKLFESSFGLDYTLGLYITAGVVVLYSTFGGFTAVSITDFVQGCIMLLALVVVPVVTLMELGGWSHVQSNLPVFKIEFLSLINLPLLAIISAMSWGLGYFGQPHIIVRFMAIAKVSEVATARRIGMSWMVVSIIGTISVGLVGAAYVQAKGLSLADSETIFIFLSTTLFHPLVAGFLLAAILAAIMSTISSQLLVASSSLTEDVYYTFLRKQASESERLIVSRASVILVALVAVALAHNRDNSILSLVGNAWAGFGAAFGPVILLSVFWARMTKQGALAGMFFGAATVLFWVYAPIHIGEVSLRDEMYEIVPGFIVGLVATVLVSLCTRVDAELMQQHKEVEKKLHQALAE